MGAAIARLGFTVMTGGGPGIMEAANRGAKEAGGRSVGCTIELPSEQPANAYLDRCVRLHYFFVRKTLLVKYSYAFVVMPGGRRHARRVIRSAHADSNREDQKFSGRYHGNRLLERTDRLHEQNGATPNDRGHRPKPDLHDRFRRGSHRAHSHPRNRTVRSQARRAGASSARVPLARRARAVGWFQLLDGRVTCAMGIENDPPD